MTKRLFILCFVIMHWERLREHAPSEALKAWGQVNAYLKGREG